MPTKRTLLVHPLCLETSSQERKHIMRKREWDRGSSAAVVSRLYNPMRRNKFMWWIAGVGVCRGFAGLHVSLIQTVCSNFQLLHTLSRLLAHHQRADHHKCSAHELGPWVHGRCRGKWPSELMPISAAQLPLQCPQGLWEQDRCGRPHTGCSWQKSSVRSVCRGLARPLLARSFRGQGTGWQFPSRIEGGLCTHGLTRRCLVLEV